jgi:hypothetical protein
MPEGANCIHISLLALFVSCTYGNTFHSHPGHALPQKVQNFLHRSHESNSKPVHAVFVVHKLAIGQVFLRVLWSAHLYHAASVLCSFTHPSITGTTQFQQSTPPLLNNTLHLYHHHYIYLLSVPFLCCHYPTPSKASFTDLMGSILNVKMKAHPQFMNENRN